MVEKLLENVINEMAPHLNPDQMEHLSNVLSGNFRGDAGAAGDQNVHHADQAPLSQQLLGLPDHRGTGPQ